MLMDRYPIILYIGAAILGKVGGEMMITDPFIENLLHPNKAVEYGVMIFFVLFVLGFARWLIKKKKAKSAKDKEAMGAAAKAPVPTAD
jgi:predicted tellurium resistance membrane protein TerC